MRRSGFTQVRETLILLYQSQIDVADRCSTLDGERGEIGIAANAIAQTIIFKREPQYSRDETMMNLYQNGLRSMKSVKAQAGAIRQIAEIASGVTNRELRSSHNERTSALCNLAIDQVVQVGAIAGRAGLAIEQIGGLSILRSVEDHELVAARINACREPIGIIRQNTASFAVNCDDYLVENGVAPLPRLQ